MFFFILWISVTISFNELKTCISLPQFKELSENKPFVKSYGFKEDYDKKGIDDLIKNIISKEETSDLENIQSIFLFIY